MSWLRVSASVSWTSSSLLTPDHGRGNSGSEQIHFFCRHFGLGESLQLGCSFTAFNFLLFQQMSRIIFLLSTTKEFSFNTYTIHYIYTVTQASHRSRSLLALVFKKKLAFVIRLFSCFGPFHSFDKLMLIGSS